jgi:Xaa-Pro aminopeptidase
MITSVLAIKDDAEVNNIKKACEITTKIFSKCLKDQVVNIIDNEKVRNKKELKKILIFNFKESKTFKII